MSIHYVTGNLLEANVEALVNTVNCEGYMGKGLAYQFKLSYPENNKDYIKACKNGNLKIGKVHYFKENDKILINFPTKDKWRQKSKIEYIEQGLDSLILIIKQLKIKSIAIPPLGSGNGGLIWDEVKPIILEKLSEIKNMVDILIYEPSKNYKPLSVKEPKLSLSALILIKFKENLNKFTKIRLQKAAYFMTIFANDSYFKFKKYKYGPYDNSIDIISKNIRLYKEYYSITDEKELYNSIYNRIVSDDVNNKLNKYDTHIKKACDYLNSLKTDKEVECVATIAFIIQQNKSLTDTQIIDKFRLWSKDKSERFSEDEILKGIYNLYENNIIQKDLIGYIIDN